MLILGALAFTLVALVVLGVFLNEYSKVSAMKAKARSDLKFQVESAMTKKDVSSLKRIQLMHGSELEEIDKGLGLRIGGYVDELIIEQDEAKKYKQP